MILAEEVASQAARISRTERIWLVVGGGGTRGSQSKSYSFIELNRK